MNAIHRKRDAGSAAGILFSCGVRFVVAEDDSLCRVVETMYYIVSLPGVVLLCISETMWYIVSTLRVGRFVF